MSNWLKQSTVVTISFGPFVDPDDGKTLATGLVSALDHASTGIKLSRDGGALAVRHAAVTATTYDDYGNYLVTLDATDTATLGSLRVQFAAAASCLPVWVDFQVVPENVYDWLVGGSGKLLLAQLAITATGDDSAIVATGAGRGAGIIATGGATGDGSLLIGGGTSGNGMTLRADTDGYGLYVQAAAGEGGRAGFNIAGAGSGAGISATGGQTGNGVTITGGATSGAGASIMAAADGNGMTIQAAGAEGYGVTVAGSGTADGVSVSSGEGATGNAVRLVALSTDGSGLSLTGTGTGEALHVELPDSVAADGSLPTLQQALYEILQFLTEKSVTSTTLTVKKVDGSTSLMVFALDSATDPTSITRTS